MLFIRSNPNASRRTVSHSRTRIEGLPFFNQSCPLPAICSYRHYLRLFYIIHDGNPLSSKEKNHSNVALKLPIFASLLRARNLSLVFVPSRVSINEIVPMFQTRRWNKCIAYTYRVQLIEL